MDNNGWIKLHRKLWDNPRSKDPEWVAVWIYLLNLATHKEYDVVFKGQRIKLYPGQLITGRLSLAKKTGVDTNKVTRILETLKSEQQIEQQASNKNRLITIKNWHFYQSGEQQNEQQVNNNRTTSEQQVNTNKKYKNIKNDKNDKNGDTPPLGKKEKFLDFILLDPEELEKLKTELGQHLGEYMDRLNGYIGSTGKKYKSHYFTILNWWRKDSEKRSKNKIIPLSPDYD